MDPHNIQILIYTTIIFFSIGVTIVTGVYTWRRRSVPGAHSFSLLLLLEAIWTVAFLLEAFDDVLAEKIFWDNVQWVASLLIPLAMLSFVLEYTGRSIRRPGRGWVLLAAIPALTIALIYTNPWHGLAIQNMRLVAAEPFSEYTYDYGPLLAVGMVYSYALMLLPLAYLARLFFRQRGIYRAQTLIVFTGFFVPILGTLLTLLGFRPWQFRDFSPITFAVSNLLVTVGLFRYRIFDLLPLARDLVVESMEDGVIVLDTHKRLVDMNWAAKVMIGQPHMRPHGQGLEALGLGGLAPQDLQPGMPPLHCEGVGQDACAGKPLDMHATCIFRGEDNLAGYLILLHDISDRKRAETLQQAVHTELELQVAARTEELSRTVRRLEGEIAQRRAIEDALLSKTQNLEVISRLSIQLADAPDEVEIVPLAAEYLREATGALACIISLYDADAGLLIVKHVAAQEQVLRRAIDHLPGLPNLQMAVTVEDRQKMLSVRVKKYATLADVTFGAIPEALSRRVMKLLKVGEMISANLHVEGELYGTLLICLPVGAEVPAVDMLEAAAHVISVTLRRKRAEEDLRSSELRFRTLLENSNDLISVLDASGNQLFTYNVDNRDRVLGYPPEVMMAKNVMDFIHPDDLPRAKEIMARICEKPGNYDLFEMRYRHMDGSWVTLETYAQNMMDNPLVRGVVSTSRNITERVRAEEEQRRLNRTLAMISECNHALVRMDDELILLETICRIIVEMGGHHLAWINALQEQPVRRLTPTIFYSTHEDLFTQRISSEVGMIFNDESETAYPPDVLAERREMNVNLIRLLEVGDPIVMNDMDLFIYPLYRAEAQAQGIQSLVILPLAFGGELYGGLHIHSPMKDRFDDKEVELLSELAQDVSFGIHARRMRVSRDLAERDARQANTELHQAYELTLEGWSRALEMRERETAGHSKRVVELTLAMAEQLGFSEEECDHIRRGALLHDIGKMGIPDSILLKPAKLTPEDWVIMRMHPTYARDLLSGIPYLAQSLVIPYCHHERWDGSGYPNGLMGEEIPLQARIFAVVDVWDALSWDRPYRKAWPQKDILQYIEDNSGTLFDPQVVRLFLRVVPQMSAYLSLAEQVSR